MQGRLEPAHLINKIKALLQSLAKEQLALCDFVIQFNRARAFPTKRSNQLPSDAEAEIDLLSIEIVYDNQDIAVCLLSTLPVLRILSMNASYKSTIKKYPRDQKTGICLSVFSRAIVVAKRPSGLRLFSDRKWGQNRRMSSCRAWTIFEIRIQV